jgi:hypothetical protein
VPAIRSNCSAPFSLLMPEWTAILTPLLFNCARTVPEPHLLHPWNLRFERKQIPRIVVNIRNCRSAMEPLEAARLPWAQGVGRSNRPTPTKRINRFWVFAKGIPVVS